MMCTSFGTCVHCSAAVTVGTLTLETFEQFEATSLCPACQALARGSATEQRVAA